MDEEPTTVIIQRYLDALPRPVRVWDEERALERPDRVEKVPPPTLP